MAVAYPINIIGVKLSTFNSSGAGGPLVPRADPDRGGRGACQALVPGNLCTVQYSAVQSSIGSQVTGHLDSDDLLISADVDEVMARAALHQLRWCQTREVTITPSPLPQTSALDVC